MVKTITVVKNPLFQRTEPREEEQPTPAQPQEQPTPQQPESAPLFDFGDLNGGPVVRPLGIGLTGNELAALDKLAEVYHASRHALLRIALRTFLENVQAGKIDLYEHLIARPQPKNKAKL
jgi:hypothetical protein